ncbi:class I SAM-dependent methyltransferase [Candidatus Pelagibacter sp.]|nr:class I SAM-dependent methyltransferase [Candidatus Pelagibacter sp.]|tara:strand:+ start:43 stop:723 length:681 start_codon:yes stop_codon:yes gene_type:complete
MREFNLLDEYPKLDKPRFVSDQKRTIFNRIIATKRDQNFFDGDRDNGYGGYKYDGRWSNVAKKISEEYSINNSSSILHINSEKGYLIYDFKKLFPKLKVLGIETSDYAIKNSIDDIKSNILKVENYLNLKFTDNSFDFVLAIGVVYALSLTDAISCIKEIQRVSKGKSFINLASYETEKDYQLFKKWSLLGTSFYKKKDWIEILKTCNYTGDYFFTNAQTLNLQDE